MVAQHEIGTRVNRGLAWLGIGSAMVAVLDIVSMLLILSFWISPDQYGIATKAVWIFPILDQATDLGLSAAVVQRDDHDHDTLSTVFWLNVTIALGLFAILALAAPIVATRFYGEAIVGSLLIAYGTKLIWQNIYFIPASLMKRDMRFKELAVIRILANLAEFVSKIAFAATGFGIWCFVLGPLCRVLVTGVACQLRRPWRPRFVLRPRQAWAYVTFGLKTSTSQMLFFLYTNLDYPIVGYYFGNAALGIYKLAYDIVLEPARAISATVVDIAFPTFARLRHHKDQLVAQFVSLTRLNLVTVMTYAVIVFVIADDLLALAFPEYTEAAPAIRLLCGVGVLRAVSFVMPPLLDGVGHPGRTLAYTVTAAVTLPLCFLLGAHLLGGRLGFESVALAWAVGYPVAFAVLTVLTVATLAIPLARFLRAVVGVPLCLLVALAIGLAVQWLAAPLPAIARMPLTSAVMLATIGVLLAYTQGLSVAAARRALKGAPAPSP
jgi:teichuronic acid exporter